MGDGRGTRDRRGTRRGNDRYRTAEKRKRQVGTEGDKRQMGDMEGTKERKGRWDKRQARDRGGTYGGLDETPDRWETGEGQEARGGRGEIRDRVGTRDRGGTRDR